MPRKTGTRPSFLQLDGEDDTVSSPPPSSAPDASSGEEEDIIFVGKCDYDEITPFSSVYNTPPEKVRSSIPELGIGTFFEIDKSSGHYVYQFQNGRLYEF